MLCDLLSRSTGSAACQTNRVQVRPHAHTHNTLSKVGTVGLWLRHMRIHAPLSSNMRNRTWTNWNGKYQVWNWSTDVKTRSWKWINASELLHQMRTRNMWNVWRPQENMSRFRSWKWRMKWTVQPVCLSEIRVVGGLWAQAACLEPLAMNQWHKCRTRMITPTFRIPNHPEP